MTSYLDALEAMHILLDRAGEHRWRDWIGEDIRQWQTSNSVEHHLGAYGGNGSFNDTGFTDPWVDQLFRDLKTVCHHLAKRVNRPVTIRELESSMGRFGSWLEGWRCLKCGYGEVTEYDVERYVAYWIIRRGILKAVRTSKLSKFVENVLARKIDDVDVERSRVRKTAIRSGLKSRSREGWMSPCPSCQSDDTGVYRWVEKGVLRRRFEAARVNLS